MIVCVIRLDMTTPPWWRKKITVHYYYKNDSVLDSGLEGGGGGPALLQKHGGWEEVDLQQEGYEFLPPLLLVQARASEQSSHQGQVSCERKRRRGITLINGFGT